MPASAAQGGAVGFIVVASVAGSVGVGAVLANPKPDGCRNVEAVFVAAFRATHVEKIAHRVSPLVVVLGCRGLHRKKAAPWRRGLCLGQYSSASMIVRTRVVFDGSAGSSEPYSQAAS